MPLFPSARKSSNHSTEPSIESANDCKNWLNALAALDEQEQFIRISKFLRTLLESILPPQRKIEIVDPLRALIYKALHGRISESGLRRSVPLETSETDKLWILLDATTNLCDVYQSIVVKFTSTTRTKTLLSTPATTAEAMNTMRLHALHRVLDLHAYLLVFYFYMRVAVTGSMWDDHCRMGQLVRELEGQDIVIPDELEIALTKTCRQAFIFPVLLGLSDPCALSALEFHATLNCAQRWSNKVGFRINIIANNQATAGQNIEHSGPAVRLENHQVRLDTRNLQKSIERRFAGLDAGKTPQQLGLGAAISTNTSRALLQRLQRLWGPSTPALIDSPEHNWRQPATTLALAVTGTANSAPAAAVFSSSANQKMVAHRPENQATLDQEKLFCLFEQAENWHLIGETADTLLFTRHLPKPTLNLQQKVSLKLGGMEDETPHLLGYIQALQQSTHESDAGVIRPTINHLVRVRLLPGIPVFVSGSIDDVDIEFAYVLTTTTPDIPANSTMQLWQRVQMAPQISSLVIPAASYRPGRTLCASAAGVAAILRFDELLMRGVDFDCIRFTMI